jgi:hypothetical protein
MLGATELAFDVNIIGRILLPGHGLLPFPDQASWVPQHVLSGALTVLAFIAIIRLVGEPQVLPAGAVISAMLAACAFGSS